ASGGQIEPLQDPLRQLPGGAADLPGEDQGEVGSQVAMLGVARPRELEGGLAGPAQLGRDPLELAPQGFRHLLRRCGGRRPVALPRGGTGLALVAAGSAIALVRLGGLLVALRTVVRDVEARALEQEARAGREQALGLLAAPRASGPGLGADPLEQLELVPLGAPVLVGRHRSLRVSSKLET